METEPVSPVAIFLGTFTMVYGMMSLVDDVCDALKSHSAKQAYKDAEDFIDKHVEKWSKEAEEKAAA